MARGADGLIWAGTRGGAVRFDGEGWAAVDIGEPEAGIAAILAASDGSTWLAGPFGVHQQSAGGSGVTYLFGGAIDLPARVAFSLHQAPDGSVWTGTTTGAARFDASGWTTVTVDDGLPTPVVHDVVTDASGVMWFAFRDGGVARRDADGWTRFLEEHNARKLFVSGNGLLWVGTGGAGVFVFDGSTWTHYQDGATVLPWAEDSGRAASGSRTRVVESYVSTARHGRASAWLTACQARRSSPWPSI